MQPPTSTTTRACEGRTAVVPAAVHLVVELAVQIVLSALLLELLARVLALAVQQPAVGRVVLDRLLDHSLGLVRALLLDEAHERLGRLGVVRGQHLRELLLELRIGEVQLVVRHADLLRGLHASERIGACSYELRHRARRRGAYLHCAKACTALSRPQTCLGHDDGVTAAWCSEARLSC
jgi:hypothetical protein